MNLVSGRTRHVFLQATGMKSRINLSSDWTFFSELSQVNVISYCHVVSRSLENFILAAEI